MLHVKIFVYLYVQNKSLYYNMVIQEFYIVFILVRPTLKGTLLFLKGLLKASKEC